jgi:thermitase
MSEGVLHALRALAVALLTVALISIVRLMMERPDGGKVATADAAPKSHTERVSAEAVKPEAVQVEAKDEGTPTLASEELTLPDGSLPDVALLSFKSRAAFDAFLKRAAQSGLVITGRADGLNALRVAFDDIAKLRRELKEHAADYAGAGANFPVAVPGLPSPEQRKGGGDLPFGSAFLRAIGAGPNVDRSQWGQGVTVAVIDSGVASHPAFAEGQVQHLDLVKDGLAFEGHGTAIASLIAGNVDGAQGVSPAAKILDVRIAGSNGSSDSFQLAQGIQAAVDRGVQVINISMGSYGDSPLVAQAVQNALAKGIVVVASAGNEQASTKAWPAAYPGVVSVSGVDAAGKLAYFSNTGDPTLSAPAVGIPSAYEKDSQPLLAQGDGTSQAAALVSGAAAAIRGAGGDALKVLTNNALNTGLNSHEGGAGMLRLPAKLR